MNHHRTRQMLHVAAGVLLLLGLLLTYQSIRKTPDALRHVRQKITDLNTLRREQESLSQVHAAMQTFDRLPPSRPIPLATLLKEALPGVQADVRPEEVRPAASGWSVRRADIIVHKTNLSGLEHFLERAEQQRPPWRLRACDIVATEGEAGSGRVTVVLEALARAK